jgi:hypothetical protein
LPDVRAGKVSFVGMDKVEEIGSENNICLVAEMGGEDGVEVSKGEVGGEESPV